MRTLTTHKVNGLNEALAINVLDEPGSGGACHLYEILIPDSVPTKPGVTVYCGIQFQNGPIQTPADMNGISGEALLAILIDRMQCFQTGPYACRENALALTKLEEAMFWLQKRTRDRMLRGVEGTHNK